MISICNYGYLYFSRITTVLIWIMAIHNWITDNHNWINNWIKDIHNWVIDMHIELWISMIKEIQLSIFIITHMQLRISTLQVRYIQSYVVDIHNYRVYSLWLYCTYRLNNRVDHLDGCHTDQQSNVTMLKVTKQLCYICRAKLSYIVK